VLQGYIAILKKKQADPGLNEYCIKSASAAERIAVMIQFTKEYEEIGMDDPAWQDARTLVDTAANGIQPGQLTVENDLPARSEVFADPLIIKVFYNLLDNAVRYGGRITTIRFFVEKCDSACIIVCEDDGDGIPADEKEKIFERGYGKNTGMGLFLSREILDITSITIRETGEPGKGARFEMTVPKGMWRSTEKGI
jgi:signal transduction histidine kinase